MSKFKLTFRTKRFLKNFPTAQESRHYKLAWFKNISFPATL